MSLYAILDQDYAGDIATVRGWSEFVEWATDLDPEKFASLVHLAEYGWSQALPDLQAQLAEAVQESHPSRWVLSICRNLYAILKHRGTAEVIVVTDGVGGDDAVAESPAQVPQVHDEAARLSMTENVAFYQALREELKAKRQAASFDAFFQAMQAEHERRPNDRAEG